MEMRNGKCKCKACVEFPESAIRKWNMNDSERGEKNKEGGGGLGGDCQRFELP